MMVGIEALLYLGTIFGAVSITNGLYDSGFLRNGYGRFIAGGSTTFVSSEFLQGYTNLESFITASANGSLGIGGFVFIGGLVALLITWAGNLIYHRQAVM